MNIETFDEILIDKTLEAKEDYKSILEVNYEYGLPLEGVSKQLDKLNEVQIGIVDFYKNITDGFELNWSKDKKRIIGGSIELVKAEYLFKDQKEFGLYDDDTVKENDNIQYFQPFDICSSESEVGFIIKPDNIYKSVFYHEAGESELHSLDLDYNGYTIMAIEARVFDYWQLVLLHYNGSSMGSAETKVFKEEMPKLFPGWTWKEFIEKYENLRLSKQ